MPLKLFLLFLIFFPQVSWGDANSNSSQLLIGEQNGTNAGRYRSLKFSNGTTTNNGDGSISVTNTGGGGGAWTLTDGSNSVANVSQVTVTGGTVGGSGGLATLLITGGSSQWINGPSSSINYVAGNVGVGTSTVPKQFVVGSTGQATIDSTGNIATSGIIGTTNAGNSTTPSLYVGETKAGLYLPVSGDLGFIANGIERMAFDTNGNLGIGNASSALFFVDADLNQNTATELHLGNNNGGTTAFADFNAGNGSKSIQVGVLGTAYTPSGMYASSDSFIIGTSNIDINADTATGVIKFGAGGTSEQMRLSAGGNLGIGSVTPGQVLDVQGNIRASSNVFVGAQPVCQQNGTNCPASSGSNFWQLGSGGNVGINTTNNVGIGSLNPGQSLDVTGTVRAIAFNKFGGTSSQFLKADGSVDSSSYITGNQTITLSGDTTGSGTTAITTTLKNTGTAGTYRSTTFDAQGRETSGTNPTTFAGYALSDTSANLAAALTDETGTGVAVFGTAPTFTTSINTGAANIITDTTTGTKIGTATNQKLGFFNATPVIQQTGNICTAAQTLGLVASCTESGGGSNYWTLNGGAGNVGISTTNTVGIGTTLGSAALTIMNGNVGIGTWNPTSPFQVSSSNAISATFPTNVGIGSANPGQVLDVTGTTRTTNLTITSIATGTQCVQANSSGVISGTGSACGAGGGSSNWTYTSSGNVGLSTSAAVGIGTTFISTAGLTVMNGNVGIGTWIPQQALDVIGAGRFTGSGNTTLNPSGGNVGIGTLTPGQLLDVQGNIRVSLLGSTLAIASGTNGCMGQATLSSGTVTVSTTCTPSTSLGIFLTDAQSSITNVGSVTIATVTAGTSFVVQSTNILDASKVNWWVQKAS